MNFPAYVTTLCAVLRENGKQAYIVGGAVRDTLLGRPVHDYDVATDALPDEVEQMFPRATSPTGKKYGTVTVHMGHSEDIEVTTFRADGRYYDGRRPEAVRFATTIEEDLSRRDFTMNAMAYHPASGVVVDPYAGQADLHERRLRCVRKASDRFLEDALRMLRAIRFAADYDLKIDVDISFAMDELHWLIDRLPEARIQAEFSKMLTSKNPAFAVGWLEGTGLLGHISPCHMLQSRIRASKPHVHDCWEHTTVALDKANGVPGRSLRLALAAFYHDVGKPFCMTVGDDGRQHYYGHELAGERIVRDELTRLRYPSDLVEDVAKLVRHHMFSETMGYAGIRRLRAAIGREDLWEDLLDLKMCDLVAIDPGMDFGKWHEFIEKEWLVRNGSPCKPRLAVSGKDIITLGLAPGPQIGEVIKELTEAILEDPSKNTRDNLLAMAWAMTQGDEVKK